MMALATDFAAATGLLGLTRTEDHVYRWFDGRTASGPLVSVTTILRVLDKSGPLVGWAKREVANAAVRNHDTVATMRAASGDEATARWLATIPGYQRDTAANLGTAVHGIAEAIARGQEVTVTEEQLPYVRSYQAWRDQWKPRYLAAEEMVCSLSHGYAGTLDMIVEMAGSTWMVDIKTSKGTYPETALQLAAYANADFVGRPGIAQKFRIPKAEHYAVLHLRPEGYAVVPYTVTDETWRAFLQAKALHEWTLGEGLRVMGERRTTP
jgi:hypothetical protein